jgi:peptide/nickel transport system permease protein
MHFPSLPPRLKRIVHRLLVTVPVLFGVSLLSFLLLNVLPANAARLLLGISATPEQVMRLETQLHINRPALSRYWDWLAHAIVGNFGHSLASGQPVTALILSRALVTIELVAYACVLSLCAAVPLALLAARWPRGVLDHLIGILGLGGLSIPSYVLAPVLVLAFSIQVPLFPSFGFVPPAAGILKSLYSLTLPAVSLALPLAGLYARFLRSDLLEQIYSEDYIQTALAKGAGPWRVLAHHALRNSLLGLLTVLGLNFGVLIGGSVVIEQIFALPGVGQLLLQAINTRDTPVVAAITLLLAVATVLSNLGVDLLYSALDPRIDGSPY